MGEGQGVQYPPLCQGYTNHREVVLPYDLYPEPEPTLSASVLGIELRAAELHTQP